MMNFGVDFLGFCGLFAQNVAMGFALIFGFRVLGRDHHNLISEVLWLLVASIIIFLMLVGILLMELPIAIGYLPYSLVLTLLLMVIGALPSVLAKIKHREPIEMRFLFRLTTYFACAAGCAQLMFAKLALVAVTQAIAGGIAFLIGGSLVGWNGKRRWAMYSVLSWGNANLLFIVWMQLVHDRWAHVDELLSLQSSEDLWAATAAWIGFWGLVDFFFRKTHQMQVLDRRLAQTQTAADH